MRWSILDVPNLRIFAELGGNSVLKFSRRLSKANPPLKCVRLDGRFKEGLTKDAISALSVFYSLQIIEIEAGEGDELNAVVNWASETLRKCAEQTRGARNWNLRGSTRSTRPVCYRSANLEPRIVRILRYKTVPSYAYGRQPINFIPVKIEEHPVEIYSC
ncbi:hypothetical protein OPQ81_010334 [Rhizoctonia solani]|nr:hypothetical protein OPQ81_010334 [Rhizoctonia solani]